MRTILLTILLTAAWAQAQPANPFVVHSTYLGGDRIDTATTVATDSDGNTYVAGDTTSTNFPWKAAFGPTPTASSNGWLVKIAPDGQKILWSVAIGGRSNTRPNAIALDPAGNVWVTGRTGASDFPLLHPVQDKETGLNIVFLMKISPEGKLLYSTFFGGERNDEANAIAIDGDGNVIIAGRAGSEKFPLKNPMRSKWVGGDAFIAKFDNNGQLLWSTYFGAIGNDEIFGVAVGPDNDLYVVGETNSTDLGTEATWIPKYVGASGFAARVSSNGDRVLWATFIGARPGYSRATAVTVDANGNPYIVGYTSSKDFPTTDNALQRKYAGGFRDAFLVKLTPDGHSADYSTFLGGSFTGASDPDEAATSVKVDGHGFVYVGGFTSSSDFATARAIQDVPRGVQEYWLARLDIVNSKLISSTFWGGSKIDTFSALAFGPGENVTFVGETFSADFRLEKPVQKAMLGTADASITRICDPWLASVVNDVTFFYTQGQTVPDPQEWDLYDGCTLPHEATATIGDAPWLSLDKDRIAFPNAKLKAFVNPADLAPGDYTTTITVLVPEAANGPITIPVTLHVFEPPPPVDPAPAEARKRP